MAVSEKTGSTKREIQWFWVLWYIHLYILGFYGLYLLIFHASWLTIIFAINLMFIGTLGLTIGAHRLWAHRAYEAQWYVKVFLMLAQTLAGVGPIHDWVLAHRVHHKFYGTEDDPYNHSKGFLYSHFVTNFYKKPANWEKVSRSVDIRDIELDLILWFQKIFYVPLFLIFGLLLPMNAPAEYWGENIGTTVLILGFLRLAVLLNVSWLINSAMNVWGLEAHEKYPYGGDLVFLINKSYWLNYHYLVPYDWKSGEFGNYENGCTTGVLKILSIFGVVSKLKTSTNQNIREALYQLASSKKTVAEVFDQVEEISKLESAQVQLQYHH